MIENAKKILREQPRKWLLTGVNGFIGSHILEELLKLNQHVVGFDNYVIAENSHLDILSRRIPQHQWKNFEFLESDINNINLGKGLLKNIDIISHHAALTTSIDAEISQLDCHFHNTTAFLHLLEEARKVKVKRFIYASSSAVYGNTQKVPNSEGHEGKPLSPYAANKKLNEQYAQIIGEQFNLETIGLRYFNVYGPRQMANHPFSAVIPKWFSSALKGEPITLYGNGEVTRDFFYIEDAVNANLLSAVVENPAAFNEVFNIGSGRETPLIQLYEKILHFCPDSSSLQILKPARKGEILRSYANLDKSREILGFEPIANSHNQLDKVFEYFASNEQL